MYSNPPSVVFGRAPSKSRSSFQGTNSLVEGDGKESVLFQEPSKVSSKLSNEERLRLIQLEIAQREACKVLKTVCEETSRQFNVTLGADIEITDFLNGILLLGNLTKRIGTQKLELLNEIASLTCQISKEKESKTETINHLEQIISNLQAENVVANDSISEINVKNNHKINLLQKEIFLLQESIEKLKLENERLESKLQYSERRLLDIPRLEEAVLRNAKSMIRQQEISNTKTKIETKKNQEEMKTLTFWKNKAKVLEDENLKLLDENQNLQNQSRLIHSKYTQLLSATTRTTKAPTSSFIPRPSSAPSYRTGTKGNGTGHLDYDGLRKSSNVQENSNGKLSVSRLSLSMERKMENMNSDEIMKLKSENQTKTTQIINLAQKLSRARAYPLLSIDDEEEDILGQGDNLLLHENMYDSTKVNNLGYRDKKYSGNGYMEEELESNSSTFLKEEEKYQEKRIENGVKLQLEYTNRRSTKKSMSKHLNEIRKSQQFGKFLDEILENETPKIISLT